MASIDVYRTQIRRAEDKARRDDILFRAAKDPEICSRDYKELIRDAFGPIFENTPPRGSRK